MTTKGDFNMAVDRAHRAELCGLSSHVGLVVPRAGVELYGEEGTLAIDCAAAVSLALFDTIRSDVAKMVLTARPH